MPVRKTAIAVPADVLEAVDDAARARGESRSRFISHVLRVAVRARRDAEITRRLNEVFQDERLAAEHLRMVRDLDAAAGGDSDGGWREP
jgi:metal-responsive CopG/Arc/MetJ family transcriptional regulator